MRQKWRNLLFLHWRVPPADLRPLIPTGLELDLHEGRAYVGLVPFTMRGVRPVGLPPVPGLSYFHETNVRTYVHRDGKDPGVWFFSLDAANSIAVRLARTFFHLPYHHARMFLEREDPRSGQESISLLCAGTRCSTTQPRPASYLIRARAGGPLQHANPGSIEHFLVERYILYSQGAGGIYRGQVNHVPYPIQSAELLTLDESLLAAAGLQRPDKEALAHFVCGVDVDIFPLRHVTPSAL